jgi:hypothetical protein
MMLNIIGWSFINLINCSRSNPFTSGNGGYKDFKKLLLFTPIFFLVSGLVVYRSRHSLDGYCDSPNHEIYLTDPHTLNLAQQNVATKIKPQPDKQSSVQYFTLDGDIDTTLLFMHSFAQNDVFKSPTVAEDKEQDPACYEYSDEEVFDFNWSHFVIGFFFLGLQYTHMDFGPF